MALQNEALEEANAVSSGLSPIHPSWPNLPHSVQTNFQDQIQGHPDPRAELDVAPAVGKARELALARDSDPWVGKRLTVVDDEKTRQLNESGLSYALQSDTGQEEAVVTNEWCSKPALSYSRVTTSKDVMAEAALSEVEVDAFQRKLRAENGASTESYTGWPGSSRQYEGSRIDAGE